MPQRKIKVPSKIGSSPRRSEKIEGPKRVNPAFAKFVGGERAFAIEKIRESKNMIAHVLENMCEQSSMVETGVGGRAAFALGYVYGRLREIVEQLT